MKVITCNSYLLEHSALRPSKETQSSHSLTELQKELIQYIANMLPYRDIRRLMQTSKYINDAIKLYEKDLVAEKVIEMSILSRSIDHNCLFIIEIAKERLTWPLINYLTKNKPDSGQVLQHHKPHSGQALQHHKHIVITGEQFIAVTMCIWNFYLTDKISIDDVSIRIKYVLDRTEVKINDVEDYSYKMSKATLLDMLVYSLIFNSILECRYTILYRMIIDMIMMYDPVLTEYGKDCWYGYINSFPYLFYKKEISDVYVLINHML